MAGQRVTVLAPTGLRKYLTRPFVKATYPGKFRSMSISMVGVGLQLTPPRLFIFVISACLSLILIQCSDAPVSVEEVYCPNEAKISFGQWREYTIPPDTLRCRIHFIADSLQLQDTLSFRVTQWYAFHPGRVIGSKPIHVELSSENGDAERFPLITAKWEPCETRIGDLEVFRVIIPKEISTDVNPHDGVLDVSPEGEMISGRYVSHCSGDTLQTQVVISSTDVVNDHN